MRLERIISSRWSATSGAREDDLLIGCGDVHVEPLLGDRLQSGTARRVAYHALEPDTLCRQRVALLTELANVGLLPHAVDSPCYDARSHQDETDEHHGDERPATRAYSALRHALSRALRARGFRVISSSEAMIGRRVRVLPRGRPRHVQTGCLGGQMQDALQSRKACFTKRSSPE